MKNALCENCGEPHAKYLGCDLSDTATKEWKPGPLFAFLGDYAFEAHAHLKSIELLTDVLGKDTHELHWADEIMMKADHR